jgi:eukaryotic-like serine/threonine-protein kinase
MNSQIILIITSGSLTGKKYSFDTPGTYAIGRQEDLDIVFPQNDEYKNVSRHHCDFLITQIDPPKLSIVDQDSRNGTFVNGRRIISSMEVLLNQSIVLGDISVEVRLAEVDWAHEQPISSPQLELTTVLVSPQREIPPTRKIMVSLKNFFTPFSDDNDETALLTASNQAASPQFPDYQLGKLLGQGSVSEVYLATHQESGRQVALKTLQLTAAKQAEATQKFIRETEYTRVLNHPQIIKLLDFNYAQDALFYTTEYCEGGSLSNLIEQLGGKLPEILAKTIVIQILEGLEYMHTAEVPYIRLAGGGFGQGHGLVHRNLNPENILLTTVAGQLIAKISDFNLSQALNLVGMTGQLQPSNKFTGNLFYIPRAQLVFKKVTPAVDIWAAAACLYKMLTGYPPRDFDARYPVAVVMEKPAIPIGERVSYLPPGLAAVIDKALHESTDHNSYYQSATDFKVDLLKAWKVDEIIHQLRK